MERMPQFELWVRWVRSALLLGLGLLAYIPGEDRAPRAGSFQLLNPLNLHTDDEGLWYYTVDGAQVPIDPQTGTLTVNGMRLRLVPLRHSLPHGVFGLHRQQLALANRLTGYAAESLDSAVPSGTLTTDQPIFQDQADAIREEFQRSQKSRTVAVLGNGAKYQQVLMSPVEAEIVELSRLSNEQVAHMFELAAWHLDAGTNSLTYSNARDNRQELVDGALASWSARIEQTLTGLLPRGWRLRIDFTGYTTPTTPGANSSPSSPNGQSLSPKVTPAQEGSEDASPDLA